jgi:hypothetical protein
MRITLSRVSTNLFAVLNFRYYIVTRLIPCEEVTKNDKPLTNITSATSVTYSCNSTKIPRDLDVFYADMLRICPNRLPPKVSKIRAKDTVSILNVLHSDRAIGDKFFTYHPLEFLVGRGTYHPLKPSSFYCLGNIVLGVTFKNVSDGIHQHALEAYHGSAALFHLA